MYKFLFFKYPFINVGTDEENIIENFVCFINGGAGAGSRTFAPAPAP